MTSGCAVPPGYWTAVTDVRTADAAAATSGRATPYQCRSLPPRATILTRQTAAALRVPFVPRTTTTPSPACCGPSVAVVLTEPQERLVLRHFDALLTARPALHAELEAWNGDGASEGGRGAWAQPASKAAAADDDDARHQRAHETAVAATKAHLGMDSGADVAPSDDRTAALEKAADVQSRRLILWEEAALLVYHGAASRSSATSAKYPTSQQQSSATGLFGKRAAPPRREMTEFERLLARASGADESGIADDDAIRSFAIDMEPSFPAITNSVESTSSRGDGNGPAHATAIALADTTTTATAGPVVTGIDERRSAAAHTLVEQARQLYRAVNGAVLSGEGGVSAGGGAGLAFDPRVYSLQVAAIAQDLERGAASVGATTIGVLRSVALSGAGSAIFPQAGPTAPQSGLPFVGDSGDASDQNVPQGADRGSAVFSLGDVLPAESNARTQLKRAVMLAKVAARALAQPACTSASMAHSAAAELDERTRSAAAAAAADLATLGAFAASDRLVELWPGGPKALFPFACCCEWVPFRDAANAELELCDDLGAVSATSDAGGEGIGADEAAGAPTSTPVLRVRCVALPSLLTAMRDRQRAAHLDLLSAPVAAGRGGAAAPLHIRLYVRPLLSAAPGGLARGEASHLESAAERDRARDKAKLFGFMDRVRGGDATAAAVVEKLGHM